MLAPSSSQHLESEIPPRGNPQKRFSPNESGSSSFREEVRPRLTPNIGETAPTRYAPAPSDPVARQTLLQIAEEYGKLAERAARRAKEE